MQSTKAYILAALAASTVYALPAPQRRSGSITVYSITSSGLVNDGSLSKRDDSDGARDITLPPPDDNFPPDWIDWEEPCPWMCLNNTSCAVDVGLSSCGPDRCPIYCRANPRCRIPKPWEAKRDGGSLSKRNGFENCGSLSKRDYGADSSEGGDITTTTPPLPPPTPVGHWPLCPWTCRDNIWCASHGLPEHSFYNCPPMCKYNPNCKLGLYEADPWEAKSDIDGSENESGDAENGGALSKRSPIWDDHYYKMKPDGGDWGGSDDGFGSDNWGMTDGGYDGDGSNFSGSDDGGREDRPDLTPPPEPAPETNIFAAGEQSTEHGVTTSNTPLFHIGDATVGKGSVVESDGKSLKTTEHSMTVTIPLGGGVGGKKDKPGLFENVLR